MIHTRKHMFKAGKAHSSASPYNYFGRTHDSELGALHQVSHHPGGHQLRRGSKVKGPTGHGLKSWQERGGGSSASYKE